MSIKDVYRQRAPLSFKKKFNPLLRKVYYWYCLLLGKRYSTKGIGSIKNVPIKSKPFRKLSFSQQGEDLILDRILYHKLGLPYNYKGNYIDVGAYHPVSHSVTYLLYLRGWEGVAIDPSKKTKSSFSKFRSRDTFFNLIGFNFPRLASFLLS